MLSLFRFPGIVLINAFGLRHAAILTALFNLAGYGFILLNPGETLALKEAMGLNKIRLKRYKFASRVSYFVVE